MATDKKRVSISIDAEDLRILDLYSGVLNQTRSQFLVSILREFNGFIEEAMKDAKGDPDLTMRSMLRIALTKISNSI